MQEQHLNAPRPGVQSEAYIGTDTARGGRHVKCPEQVQHHQMCGSMTCND